MGTKRDALFLQIYKPFGIQVEVITLWYLVFAHLFPILCFAYGKVNIIIPAVLFEFALGYLGGLAITVGCHRYWAHKTFKASLPLQILLMILQTISSQLTIHKWCLDHRIHHKFTDTDADPHNSKRGFWFSHIGWLCSPNKTPEYRKELMYFDMSDLEKDPVVRFQSRWYWLLFLIFRIAIPEFILCYFWELTLLEAVVYGLTRHICSLHITFCVNSVAHKWGAKPYDKNISATENQLLSLFAAGEGWHNYHHIFPWDYRTSEFGWSANLSTVVIDFFAKIGWAWELKTVSPELLEKRRNRTGKIGLKEYTNGQHEADVCVRAADKKLSDPAVNSVDEVYWGWEDPTIPNDFRSATDIIKPERPK